MKYKTRGQQAKGGVATKPDITKRASVFQEISAGYGKIEERQQRRSSMMSSILSGQLNNDALTYPHSDIFFLGETKLLDLFWDPMKKKLPPLSKLVSIEFFLPGPPLSSTDVSNRDATSIVGIAEKFRKSMIRRDSIASLPSTATSNASSESSDTNDGTAGSYQTRESITGRSRGSIQRILEYDAMLGHEGGWGSVFMKDSNHSKNSVESSITTNTVDPLQSPDSLLTKDSEFLNFSDQSLHHPPANLSPSAKTNTIIPIPKFRNRSALQSSLQKSHITSRPSRNTIRRISTGRQSVTAEYDCDNQSVATCESNEPSLVVRDSESLLNMIHEEKIRATLKKTMKSTADGGDSNDSTSTYQTTRGSKFESRRALGEDENDDVSVSTYQTVRSTFESGKSVGGNPTNYCTRESSIKPEIPNLCLRQTIRKLRAQSIKSEIAPFFLPNTDTNKNNRSVEQEAQRSQVIPYMLDHSSKSESSIGHLETHIEQGSDDESELSQQNEVESPDAEGGKESFKSGGNLELTPETEEGSTSSSTSK